MRVLLTMLLMSAFAAAPALSAPTSLPAPPAGVVWQLAGTPAGTLYAGTWCGVYQLPPAAAQWQEVAGLRDVPARRLVRLDGDTLLAATAGWSPGGVWRRSADAPWQRVIDVGDAQLAASRDGMRAYAAFAGLSGPSGFPVNVLRSDDRGATWASAGPTGLGGIPTSLAVATDPASGDDVVLLTTQAIRFGGTALLRSRDRGATWELFPTYADLGQPGTISPRVVVAADGVTFYVTNRLPDYQRNVDHVRLYRDTASGSSLEEIALPAEAQSQDIVDLLGLGDTLIVATAQGVWQRAGAAARWSRFDQGLGSPTIDDLLALAPDAIYAATSIGVYRYDASARTWRYVAPGMPVCNAPGRTVYDRIPDFPVGPEHLFFPETGHALSYGFKAFWERSGGLPVFGYSLSEEFDERNADLDRAFTTQYLERERFEFHPENAGTPYEVLLGRLGAELLLAQGRDWRQEDGTVNPFPSGAGGCRSFSVGGETRSVCGPFLDYWQRHGLDLGRGGSSFDESLALFGLPLTAPQIETNSSGDRVLTQWFERARFEYHPNNPQPYRVLLGRLGAEILRLRGITTP